MNLTLLLTCCATLGSLHSLSELQIPFPYKKYGSQPERDGVSECLLSLDNVQSLWF